MAARRKRQVAEGHENSERWLLTYSDLITLLMVFFVVLYSMSRTDAEKFHRISASLEKAFNVDIMEGTASGASATGEGEGPSLVALTQPLSGSDPLDPAENQAANIRSHLATAMAGLIQAPDVAVVTSSEGVVIRLSGSFLFDSGRAELKPNAVPVLDAVAMDLRDLPNQVRVDGHTDNIPADSPRYATNWELSGARAFSVVRYLAEVGGVPSSRLSAVGFGEFRPLVENDTREHRALNRRVEVHVLSSNLPGSPSPPLVHGPAPVVPSAAVQPPSAGSGSGSGAPSPASGVAAEIGNAAGLEPESESVPASRPDWG